VEIWTCGPVDLWTCGPVALWPCELVDLCGLANWLSGPGQCRVWLSATHSLTVVAFSCSQLLYYWSVTDGDACRHLPEDYEHHMWLRETAYMVDQLGCQGVWKLPQH